MVQPVREPCCVEVLPGAAFALQVELPSAWAVLGEAFGPIVLHTIDAHGNELPRRLECPHIETRVAAPLRTVAASEIATTSTPRCETICFEQFCWQTIALPCVCAVPADVHGRALLWLRLCGGPARVTLVVTANAKTVPGSPSDHSLEAAELLVHLSGAPKRLFASASSRGAICDQIFGPLRVLAVDADGNAVGNSHFEPIVSVRGNDNSTYHDASSALSCEAQRMLWQSSMSASPVVLLWLTLRGVSGEVLIEVHDGSRCVPLGARVPIYLTGPPYFLRRAAKAERAGWLVRRGSGLWCGSSTQTVCKSSGSHSLHRAVLHSARKVAARRLLARSPTSLAALSGRTQAPMAPLRPPLCVCGYPGARATSLYACTTPPDMLSIHCVSPCVCCRAQSRRRAACWLPQQHSPNRSYAVDGARWCCAASTHLVTPWPWETISLSSASAPRHRGRGLQRAPSSTRALRHAPHRPQLFQTRLLD